MPASPQHSVRRAMPPSSRNETLPGLRATRGGSPVETLTRMWLLQAPVPVREVETALPGLVDHLCNAGILERSVSEVAPGSTCVRMAPTTLDLWVASDLTPGLDGGPQRVAADHVLGISPAATSLAELTVREPVAPRARPRHRLRRPVAAPGRARRPRRRHRRERAALWLTELNADAERARRIDVRDGQLLRAGRGRAVRPDRHQPALRDLPGHRRAAGLPRLRAAR